MQELNARPSPWHEHDKYEDEEREEEDLTQDLPMEGEEGIYGSAMQRAYPPQRGGSKRSRHQGYTHPRSAMHGWALRQASQQCPEVATATLNMLTKAEFRTVTAVLASKTPGQTARDFWRGFLPNIYCLGPLRQGSAQASKPLKGLAGNSFPCVCCAFSLCQE